MSNLTIKEIPVVMGRPGLARMWRPVKNLSGILPIKTYSFNGGPFELQKAIGRETIKFLKEKDVITSAGLNFNITKLDELLKDKAQRTIPGLILRNGERPTAKNIREAIIGRLVEPAENNFKSIYRKKHKWAVVMIDCLTKGDIDGFNILQQRFPIDYLNLSGVNFNRQDLSCWDLSGVDFRRALLREAILKTVKINDKTSFFEADCSGATIDKSMKEYLQGQKAQGLESVNWVG